MGEQLLLHSTNLANIWNRSKRNQSCLAQDPGNCRQNGIRISVPDDDQVAGRQEVETDDVDNVADHERRRTQVRKFGNLESKVKLVSKQQVE